jgi:hypothetical protein
LGELADYRLLEGNADERFCSREGAVPQNGVIGILRGRIVAARCCDATSRYSQISDSPAKTARKSQEFLKMRQIGFAALILLSVATSISARAQTSQTGNADDTARFLAGMPLSPDSPLNQLAQDPYVKQQGVYFDTAFGDIETNKLSKIRTWSDTHLTAPKAVLFYMFSGPDFLYADAFFPKATTYVLSGLEPTGSVPDLMKLPRGSIASALRNIQGSLRNVFALSYFITANMSQDLESGPLDGTLPILYVFLARSGKTIHDVSLIYLDEQGALHPVEGTSQSAPARGVKIVFSDKGGQQNTLYYFATDLTDQRNLDIALLEFCKSLGQ